MQENEGLSLQSVNGMNHLMSTVEFVENHIPERERPFFLRNVIDLLGKRVKESDGQAVLRGNKELDSSPSAERVAKQKEHPAIKLAHKMLAGEINDDIPYFRLNLKVISYYVIGEDGLRKEAVTGDMRPFARMIQKLGYVQANASCTVCIRHVRYIDYKYIYLDTYEKVSIGDRYRELCKEQLWSLRENYPDWGKDKEKYQLIPR